MQDEVVKWHRKEKKLSGKECPSERLNWTEAMKEDKKETKEGRLGPETKKHLAPITSDSDLCKYVEIAPAPHP